jgi:hypothetical protein
LEIAGKVEIAVDKRTPLHTLVPLGARPEVYRVLNIRELSRSFEDFLGGIAPSIATASRQSL